MTTMTSLDRAEMLVGMLQNEGVPADFVQSAMVYMTDNTKRLMDSVLQAFVWEGEALPGGSLYWRLGPVLPLTDGGEFTTLPDYDDRKAYVVPEKASAFYERDITNVAPSVDRVGASYLIKAAVLGMLQDEIDWHDRYQTILPEYHRAKVQALESLYWSLEEGRLVVETGAYLHTKEAFRWGYQDDPSSYWYQ